jgi:branched-chain amino acid transport system substrate-binding protein
MHSGAARRSIPVLCPAGVVQISPGATDPGLTKDVHDNDEPGVYYPDCTPQFFRTTAHDGSIGVAMVRYADEAGRRSMWVIDDTSRYGQMVRRTLDDAVEDSAIRLVGSSDVEQATPDAIAEAIAEADPDVIAFAAVADETTPALWKAIRAAAPDALIVSNETIWDSAFLSEIGSHGDGTILFSAAIDPERRAPAYRTFEADFFRAVAKETPYYGSYGYDAARVVIEALEIAVAEHDRIRQIRAALPGLIRSTDLPSTTVGDLRFDEDGDLVVQHIGVYGIDAGAVVTIGEVMAIGDS